MIMNRSSIERFCFTAAFSLTFVLAGATLAFIVSPDVEGASPLTREGLVWELLEAGASPQEAGITAKRVQGYASGFGGNIQGFDYVEIQTGAISYLKRTHDFTRTGAEKAVEAAKAAAEAFNSAGN